MTQARFYPVTEIDNLSDGKGLAFEIDGHEAVLFRQGDAFFALDNHCPHAGARIAGGKVTNGLVICPLHGARFDLATGVCRSAHGAGSLKIPVHATRIRNGMVEVAFKTDK